ncbi:hypothetical protein, variant [Aphanomyces astaci]|uniref:Uncharacterized protein n=1 Tax=Aphanomyces astaci TaxID=112090 RepID=W4H2V1_APHAT|nr:hypothetical protein, variant [Aphanomyces astaci]ETV85488.1 hypothetical protein, variant [Aphanomyces astaci]|eukprot:XP_009825506.1 hypothetical protein, variant [Aphanomyces astaci]
MNMDDNPTWGSSDLACHPPITPSVEGNGDDRQEFHYGGDGERHLSHNGSAFGGTMPRVPSFARIGTMSRAPSMTRVPSMNRVGSSSRLTRGVSSSQLVALRRRATTSTLTVVLQITNQELQNLDGFATMGMHRTVVSSFSNLCAIYVQRNKIDSLDAIAACSKSLLVLNVAFNALESLPSSEFWAHFTHLSVLDVSHNHLAKWKHVHGVQACASLVLFRIHGNPISAQPSCRAVLVNQMPFLLAVDDHVITDEEKIENAQFGPRFQAKHDRMFVHMWSPWLHGPPMVSTNEAVAPALARTLVSLKRLVESNSPVIIAQRVWRGYCSRKWKMRPLHIMRHAVHTIQRVVRGSWLRRHLWTQLRQVLVPLHKERLLLPTWEMQRYRAAPRILAVWTARRDHFRAKKAMNHIKTWLRSVVTTSSQLRQAMVSSSDQLRIYCDTESVQAVLDAAAKCMALDARLMGIDASHLASRVVPTDIAIFRPSTFNVVCREHRHSWRRTIPTTIKCDGVFRRLRRATHDRMHMLHAECNVVADDVRRLLSTTTDVSPAASPLARRHLTYQVAESQERHAWLSTNRSKYQQKVKQSHHRRTPCLFERPVAIQPRGNSHVVQVVPKAITTTPTHQMLMLFVPTSVAMHRRMLLLLKRTTHHAHALRIYSPLAIAHLCAATTLQATWRSYQVRRNCQFIKLFLQRRAILCLQRWWRCLSTLAWRADMYEACVRVVAAIDSSVVYMEERVFMTLKHPSLVQRALDAMPRLPSHGWKFKFSNRELTVPITLDESLSRLPEDEKQTYLNTFYVENGLERVGFPVWMPSTPPHEIVGREEKQVSKQQVGLIITQHCIESVVTDAVEPPTALDDTERCSAIDFGAFTACRNILQDNETLVKWSLNDVGDMNWYSAFGITLVKLEFDSVAEARHRAAMLLVKTFDARHKTYARLYTVGMLRYLWLNKPATSRHGYVFSRDWIRLGLDMPSRWGCHHDAYSHQGGGCDSAHMRHRPSTVPGATEAFSASEVTASQSHRSHLLSSHMERENDVAAAGSPTAAMLVHHVTVAKDLDPSYQLHVLKQQQADTVRLESEALEITRHHDKSVALKAKQRHVATQHFRPRPPPNATSTCPTHSSWTSTAASRKSKFQDKQLAVDSAIRADEAGEARAAAILYRMRLTQRANQATAVERQMVARESSAAIAAHKIQIDAQLQRAAYEQAQLLLVKQQRKAVEVALARRKKAQRQFARHFGQQTVGLMRCHARDRAQDRAVAALDLPVEHVQFAKVAEKKVDESIRAKRTERLVANQRHRVMQSMEIQAALEFQETQERHRLDDIQARVAQERKLKQLLQTEDF